MTNPLKYKLIFFISFMTLVNLFLVNSNPVYAYEEGDSSGDSGASSYSIYLGISKIIGGFCFVLFMNALNRKKNPGANPENTDEIIPPVPFENPGMENVSVHLTLSSEKIPYLPPFLRWITWDFTLYESQHNFLSVLLTSWSWLQQPLALVGGFIIFRTLQFLGNNSVDQTHPKSKKITIVSSNK